MTATYTIHLPPGGAPRTVAGADSLQFVKDGFYGLAFFVPALWMIYHRTWLPLLGYLAIVLALEVAMVTLGASEGQGALIAMLANGLIGLEGGTLRRWSMRRKGWQMVGIVTGSDRVECERKAIDRWLSGALTPESEVDYEYEHGDDVIGMFPPPETSRW